MPLVTIRDLSLRYQGPPLLDGVSCLIEPGQRIGLLGRNGAGKTSLLRLLSGVESPDAGEIVVAPGAKIAVLPQDVPQDVHGLVHDVIASGWAPTEQEKDQTWIVEHRVERLIEEMSLDGTVRFETLSSGMKRRVLLARAIVSEPDLLLLDEPTNHLDVESIVRLEEFLKRRKAAYLFVTHDRMFLRNLADRILEIDRGKLFDWSCDYETFLKRKEEWLLAEEKQNELFDRKLAEAEVWIRTPIQARRTRNEGRVRALEAMRRSRAERRTSTKHVDMTIQESGRSGTLVVGAENVSAGYGERTIFRDFSCAIMRGEKIGILGPNGAGKTTLLRTLLGQIQPTGGTIKLGTNLDIAYFDQLRRVLDEDKTVHENVGDGSDTIRFLDGTRHIIGYLQDFLFSPERARTPVKFLSGGERNRVLLAKLFAKPANVIVLDEPTNDLDAETLELLEARLVNFSGTVLMVSHDREFLNNVVDGVFAFENGGIKEYVGGYDDWLRQRSPPLEDATKNEAKSAKPAVSNTDAKKRKLSYKDQKELDALPNTIHELEAEIEARHTAAGDPAFYKQPPDRIAAAAAELKSLEDKLETAFARWETLEALSHG